MPIDVPPESGVFYLANGSPYSRLMDRLGLRSPPRRMLAFVVVTWAPLVAISAATDRRAVEIPILLDYESYARFLVAIPLLLLAEVIVSIFTALVVNQFTARDLVPQKEIDRFRLALREAERLRDLAWLDPALLVVALVGSILSPGRIMPAGLSIWQFAETTSLAGLTPAGWWYTLVSITVFRFLQLKWVWRFVVWYRLLWRISRLPLRLTPTHPDLEGGLGFLAQGQVAFFPVLVAESALLAGVALNSVLHAGVEFSTRTNEIVVYAVLAVAVLLVPLLFFAPQLSRTRIRGRLEYGRLASKYVQAFNRKWVSGDNPSGEPLLGSTDIQSLADLSNSYTIVKKMRVAPVSVPVLVKLAFFALVPFAAPAVATLPAGELVRLLFKIVARLMG